MIDYLQFLLLRIYWGWCYYFLLNVWDLNVFNQIPRNKLSTVLIIHRVFNYFRGIFILFNF